MHTTTKHENDSPALDASNAIPTLGCVLPGGTVIEQICGRLLAAWRGGEEICAPEVEVGHQLFAALPLDASLAAAVRFPAGSAPYFSIESLFDACREVFTSHLPTLTTAHADVFAAFVLATWVAEALPSLPVLQISAPAGQDAVVCELMSCLARRALPLQRVSIRELLKLPDGLRPTVIAQNPATRIAQEIANACTSPDSYQIQGGRCVRLSLSAVLVGGERQQRVLNLTLPPTGDYVRVGRETADLLATRLGPQLLRFRFTRSLAVAAAAVDAAQLSPQLRSVALWLLSALEGAPSLQQRLLSALTTLDEQQKAERATSIEGVVAETLLALDHEKRLQSIAIGELAELAEALAGARGVRAANAKRVGSIVRAFGIAPHRTRFGYVLDLNSLQIHAIAQALGVAAVLSSGACDLCQPSHNRPESKTHTSDVHHVHDVHDVHDNDVHDVHGHSLIASSGCVPSPQQAESGA